MIPRIVAACVFVLAVLAWNLAVAAERETRQKSKDSQDGLRQEVLELKKAIAELAARLGKIERRISRLEQSRTRVEPHAGGAPAGLRPLGSRLKVDQHGIIYEGAHPVGIWGVNGVGASLSPQVR